MAREIGRAVGVARRSPQRGTAELVARRGVVDAAIAMSRAGLSPGRSGNVSARFEDSLLITPSGLPYDVMTPADVVRVRLDGHIPPGQEAPSSELLFHLAVYRSRPDAGAVVHCHSMHATVLACARRPIPAFHYMVAVAGGDDIPLVPYATFGSDELARHVAEGLAHRNACLMANHGQIAVGANCADALALAEEVEALAEQYLKVLMLGTPHVLSRDEMARVVERFASYRRNGKR